MSTAPGPHLGGRGKAPEAEACAGAGSCYHTRERRESSPDRASEACGAVIQETVGPTRSLAAFLPAGKGARGRHCSTAFSFFKIKISTGRHFQCILLIRESHKARFQVSGVHIRDGGAVSANILCTVRNIRYGVYYRCSGGKQLYVETPPTGEHDLLSLTVNPGPVAPVGSKAFPPEGQVGQRVRCSYAAEP